MANLFIMSEDTPNFTSEGKHWIKPSTGGLFIYINGSWQGLMSGTSYALSYQVPLTVFINGIDRTYAVSNFKYKDVLTNGVDTCTFDLFDEDNTIKPTQGEEVVVWYKETALSTETKRFAGEISSFPQSPIAPGMLSFDYSISCVDYSKRLKKDLVIESYTNTAAGNIIKDLISKGYMSGYTTNNVQDGSIISYISFNYKTAFACLVELAQLIGYDWYVDYDRDIHFFSSETNYAPYELTESLATTGNYKDLRITIDKAQLRNKVTVRGGVYLSDLFTQLRVADGQQTSFNLDYKPRSPITVYVDSGAGYVQKTLGTDGINTSGYDFVVNYNEKVIKNLDLAVLTAGHKLKVTYLYEIQVLTEDTDETSIQAIKDIEGGDGVYEYVISDTSIETLDTAHDRAIAELNQYSNPVIKGTFITDQNGYRSGQLITINMPNWGYNSAQYLIQSVSGILESNNKFKYTITFATRLKGLTEFLTQLFDSGKEIIVRENETLHDLSRISTDRVTFSEAEITFEEHTGSVYVWSDDALTTPNAGVWNEFMWN